MKKLLTAGFIFIAAMLASCGPTSDAAVKYNDELVRYQTKVFEKEYQLMEAISKNMPDKLDFLLADLIRQVKESTDSVTNMEGFDGKTEMKNATLKILAAYKEVTDKEYPEMVKYSKLPDSLFTQDDDDKILDLSNAIDDKVNKTVDDFSQLQKGFADKYKFDLTPEEKEVPKKEEKK